MGEKEPAVQAVDRDDAVVYLEGHHANANVDLAALRRKIDRRLLPYMFCCYVLQFLDKVMLNVSSIESDFDSEAVPPRICHCWTIRSSRIDIALHRILTMSSMRLLWESRCTLSSKETNSRTRHPGFSSRISLQKYQMVSHPLLCICYRIYHITSHPSPSM